MDLVIQAAESAASGMAPTTSFPYVPQATELVCLNCARLLGLGESLTLTLVAEWKKKYWKSEKSCISVCDISNPVCRLKGLT